MLHLFAGRRGLRAFAAGVLLALPAMLQAQRGTGPTGIAVTGTAASATVSWQAMAGAVSYGVRRWKQDDLKCCNNAVSGIGKPAWVDYGASNEGFAQAGVYVFEVSVLLDDKTTGMSQFSWTRPETAPVTTRTALSVTTLQTMSLAAPTGVVVRNDPSALVIGWQPVYGASGYQVDVAPAAAGPWTPLVPAPIAATQFVYTPAPATLAYYRISAALSLAVSGISTTVPAMYYVPLNPLGVSAVQSHGNVKVSWNPVRGASGYTVTRSSVFGTTTSLQVSGGVSEATFPNLVSSGATSANAYDVSMFKVSAQFPPQGLSGADVGRVGYSLALFFDPSVCWPAAGELPGGPVQNPPAVVPEGPGVTLSWPMNGQVLGYRVERAPAGSAQWESLACLRPLVGIDYQRQTRVNTQTTSFQDQSIALLPSTTYQYRVTSLGPPDATGKRPSSQSVVSATTAPAPTLAVGVTASTAAATVPWVRLSWTIPPGSTAKNYLVTSSYGLRADMARQDSPNVLQLTGVPRGTHQFTVTPLYRSGVSAPATTVSVVVP